MKTWGELANDVLDHLGISGITAPPTPEDVSTVLNTMRSMVPYFENKGIFIGAFIPDSLDPACDSNIPDYFWMGFTTNTAVFSATSFGIRASDELKAMAKSSLEGMYCKKPPTADQNPFQPAGQGDRGYYYGPRFMSEANECPDHDGPMTQRYPF